MNNMIPALAAAALLAGATIVPASAAEDNKSVLTRVPDGAKTISTYYNEDVYDNEDKQIGSVTDLLVDQGGRIQAVIVGVGGFLGVGAKDVAVPFSALKVAEKGGDSYLVLETTRQALESAPSYVYDEAKRQWMPARRPS